MDEIFVKQLGDDISYIKTLSFVVAHSHKGEEVVSWKKSKIDEIQDVHEYIGTDKGFLPRFIMKA